MKQFLFFFLVINATLLQGQNLVPNPSFEEFKFAPINYALHNKDFDDNISEWETGNMTSPNIITEVLKENESYDVPVARTGRSMIGLMNNAGWFTEYISVALNTPIQAGQTYYAEFWMTVIPNKTAKDKKEDFSINPYFGIWFHKGYKFRNTKELKVTPEVSIEDNTVYSFGTWVKVSGTFQAEKDCSHIMIGQFFTDPAQQLDGFALIDDVWVESRSQLVMEVGATVILDDVNFKTGTAILEKGAFNSLKKLKAGLVANPELTIAIEGHTDAIGKSADNLVLSTQRAAAVFEYLVDQGINADRLTYKGFGESQPIASNDNANGRQKNRRVAFKVIGETEE